MKLLFKQRLFSWFDSYDIYDENGNTVFVVKGELAWGHRLRIYDASGNELGLVEEKVLTFMPRFRLYVGEEMVGEIRKEITLFRPRFTLDCNGWQVDGDIFEWNYAVTDSWQNIVCSVSKQVLRLTDTYEMEILNPEDALRSLMIVLAIDAAKCSRGD